MFEYLQMYLWLLTLKYAFAKLIINNKIWNVNLGNKNKEK